MIGFIVSCFKYNNTGKGGHYYTALSIFREMQNYANAILIVIGDQEPAAIDVSKKDINFIRVSRWVKPKDVRKLLECVREVNIDIFRS